LRGCRLFVAAETTHGLDAAQRNALGGASLGELMAIAMTNKSLDVVFRDQVPRTGGLDPVMHWCRAHYSARQLRKIPVRTLLIEASAAADGP